MEKNPYEYEGYYQTVPWMPQQNQPSAGSYVTARSSQQRSPVPPQHRPQQRGVEQKPKLPERMPKARALALAGTLKKWIVIASLASFGTFAGLAAFHQIGTTASQTSSGSTQKTAPTTSSSSQDDNGFLHQRGGNNLGSGSSSSSSNGSSSSSSASSGSSGSTQPPVSGSSVSQSH